MKRTLASSLLAVSGTLLAFSSHVFAQQSAVALPVKPQLTLEAAQTIATAASRFATEKGWPGGVAVVDAGGYPILVERMDGSTVVLAAQLAEKKARTAALFGRPSADMEAGVNGGHPSLTTLSQLGVLTLGGGRPIIIDGQIVGAVGVSVAVGAHDDIIAQVAAKALDAVQK